MTGRHVVNVDLVDVWRERGRKNLLRTLAWGDEVTVKSGDSTHVEVQFTRFEEQPDGSILPVTDIGFIEPTKSSKLKADTTVIPKNQNAVLRVNFVDVQQGDGAVIEGPDGRIILVDGGDNQMFARYLAARFRGTSEARPKTIDCIVVTHGDADHFSGLHEIFKSETNKDKKKRLFIKPLRLYHNGIVKRPSSRNGKSVPGAELLGPTTKAGKDLILTGLAANLLNVPDTEMNQQFRKWKEALQEYNNRQEIEFRRIEIGDPDAFHFFDDPNRNIRIEVLGPIPVEADGVRGLRFLGAPPPGPRVGHDSVSILSTGFTGKSASHTINGHSIVFRLTYGGFSYLFCGDLNDEASRFLTRAHNAGTLNLNAHVLKVPHHGSADFSGAFIQAVSPIVSVVSSGDEQEFQEYIHPRATLMGALGRYSRVPEPLIFVTELVAFFKTEGWVRMADDKEAKERGEFFGFSRAAFGIVKTRTDGHRLFMYTDSGNVDMKEAYAYQIDAEGVPQPVPVVRG